MSMSKKLQKKLLHKLLSSALALSVLGAGTAYAMPTGGEVQTGSVTLNGAAATTLNPASGATIANTTNALINWDAFSISAGNTLNFNTAAGTLLMNQVTGNTITRLLGTLNDTGHGSLWICNPNGIIVGANAVINPYALTLATIQNLNVDQFNHFAAGGTLTLYPKAAIEMEGRDGYDGTKGIHAVHAIEMLGTSITIGDYVSLTTENSVQTYRAIAGGVFSSTKGAPLVASTKDGEQPVATANNTVNIKEDAMIGDNNDGGSLSLVGGAVTMENHAMLDANGEGGTATIIAASNINESNPKKSHAIGTNTVTLNGIQSLVNEGGLGARIYAGKVIGDTSYFETGGVDTVTGGSENPTVPAQVYPGGDTPTPPTPDPPTPPEPTPDPPTPPGPTPPGPTPDPPTPPGPTPEPTSLTPEQAIALQNALDEQINRDPTSVYMWDGQGSMGSQGSDSGDPDHVTVQTGGDSSTFDLTKSLQGLTVSEAAARSRSAAKAYMKALQDGDKERAEQLKEALKEANRAVKILKEQEKLAKEETEKTKDATSAGRQPVNIKNLSDSDLLNREAALRDALRKAQTSEERQQIMRDLDAVHSEQTDRYKAARQAAQNAQQPGQQDLTKYENYLREAAERLNNAMNGTDANELLRAQEAYDKARSDLENAQRSGLPPRQPAGENQNTPSGVSDLLNTLRDYQQQQKQLSGELQDSGITITTSEPRQESPGPSWIDNTIGEKLLTQESDARARLRKAQTSEERRQIMKELDEIHAEETKLVNEAMKQQEQIRIRQTEEQIKAVGGEALQNATDKVSDALNKVKEANQLERDLKAKELAAHEKVRELVDQWNKEKAEGASQERLDEINKEWEKANKEWEDANSDWNNQLNQVDKANQDAKDAANALDRAQSIAREAKDDLDKFMAEQAAEKPHLESDLAQKEEEYNKLKAEADLLRSEYNKLKEESNAIEREREQLSAGYKDEIQSLVERANDALDAGNDAEYEALSERIAELTDKLTEASAKFDEENKEREATLQDMMKELYRRDDRQRSDERASFSGSLYNAERAANTAEGALDYAQQRIENHDAATKEGAQNIQDTARLRIESPNIVNEFTQNDKNLKENRDEAYRAMMNDPSDENINLYRNVNDLYNAVHDLTKTVQDAANYRPGQK